MTNTNEPQATATAGEVFTLEHYGPDWLVYRGGEVIPVMTFARKRDAERWVRLQSK